MPPTILQSEEIVSSVLEKQESDFEIDTLPVPELLDIPTQEIEDPPPPPQTLVASYVPSDQEEEVPKPIKKRKKKSTKKSQKVQKAKYIYEDEQEELYLSDQYRGESGLKSMVVYDEVQKKKSSAYQKG